MIIITPKCLRITLFLFIVFVSISYAHGWLLQGLDDDLAKFKGSDRFSFNINEKVSLEGASIMFAVYRNELFVKYLAKFLPTRSNFAILSLIILLNQIALPDVFGGLTIVDDPPSHGPANNPLFSFTRLSGSAYPPLLFPDFDFFGYPDVWVPPYDVIVADVLRTQNSWNQRENKVFWSGTINSQARKNAIDCAPSYPNTVKIERINTEKSFINQTMNDIMNTKLKKFEEIISVPPLERKYKSELQDLRRLQNYKYNLYLAGTTWSSSLKRIIASGGATMIPVPIKWEDLVSRLIINNNLMIPIRDTKKGWFSSERQFCQNMDAFINPAQGIEKKKENDLKASRLALKLQTVAKEELNRQKIFEYMSKARD